MKRDWDLIREILIEVEALDTHTRDKVAYSIEHQNPAGADAKAEHAMLLHEAGFIKAVDVSSSDRIAILSPELTWSGHELIETIRSKPVWERIKYIAADKGIELSFEAVRLLAKQALAAVIGE